MLYLLENKTCFHSILIFYQVLLLVIWFTVRVEFRLWKQGRVNIESLTLKLKAAVRHALWDNTLELKLLTAPLSSFDPPSSKYTFYLILTQTLTFIIIRYENLLCRYENKLVKTKKAKLVSKVK